MVNQGIREQPGYASTDHNDRSQQALVISGLRARTNSDHIAGDPAYDPELLAYMALHEVIADRPTFSTRSSSSPADGSDSLYTDFVIKVDVREQSYVDGIRERRGIAATAELVATGNRHESGSVIVQAVYRGESSETIVSPAVYNRIVVETFTALFDALEENQERT